MQPTRLSLVTIVLILALSAVFLILPINCDIINEHNTLKHNPSVKNADYYEPSEVISNLLEPSSEHPRIRELPLPPKPDYNQCKLLKDGDRFDCFPEDGANPEACEARGCCWIPAKTKPKIGGPVNVPNCFYPPDYNTYTYINGTETEFGLIAFLRRNYRSAYPDDVEVLMMTVKYETDSRLHVKFVDPLTARFEPAYPEVPTVDRTSQNSQYVFELNLSKPGFKVVRKSDNTTIFDANNFLNLIFSNQFLQISSKLPSSYIYGIGDHMQDLLLSTGWSSYTLFNRDASPKFNTNLYGSHPFYMVMENSSNSHGVFLLNSNAMDIILQPTPAITFRPIGGVLDLYFFLGPTPSDVVSQYTDLIGMPSMPPYWGLGFHLCKFEYRSLNRTREIMEKNIANGIPLDTQWNDMDYMDKNNDFTYDKEAFAGLPEFVRELHSRGMHYIPMIDPGVSAGEVPGTYSPYDLGIKMGIFVKNHTGQPFIGKVWNKKSTVWPDFTHPSAVDYWTQMFKTLHADVEFDGAWIDMNEPSNFLDGSFEGCPKTALENPPYVPAVLDGKLYAKTLCMSAKHYQGLHYDVHNLHGIAEAKVTNLALAEIRGKRPMIISRSTFPGIGHYAGHWTGDVFSAWLDMKYSIPHILSFSMFGIPLVGADICGFHRNTTQSLCNRWQQLGAFYPFSRNHNEYNNIDQDPASMGALVIDSTKKALKVRYSLLPYLYTLFYRAHVFGETVARPLFFEFPKDITTYNIDSQFLWGPALLIAPVLEDTVEHVTTYLPADKWYDFYTRSPIYSTGRKFNFSAPLDTIPVFVRGGYVLPQQDAKQTTTESRKTKFGLLVALNDAGEARGELFWDDGDSLNTYQQKKYSLISIEISNGVLRTENIHFDSNIIMPNLGNITVMGISKPVTEVVINDARQPFKYDNLHKCLFIDRLDVPFKKPIVVSWK